MKAALFFNDVSYLATGLNILDHRFPGAHVTQIIDRKSVALVVDLVSASDVELLKEDVDAINQNIVTHELNDEDVALLRSVKPKGADRKQIVSGATLAEQESHSNSAFFTVVTPEFV